MLFIDTLGQQLASLIWMFSRWSLSDFFVFIWTRLSCQKSRFTPIDKFLGNSNERESYGPDAKQLREGDYKINHEEELRQSRGRPFNSFPIIAHLSLFAESTKGRIPFFPHLIFSPTENSERKKKKEKKTKTAQREYYAYQKGGKKSDVLNKKESPAGDGKKAMNSLLCKLVV